MTPKALSRLRRAFRQMNRGMVLLWRLGLGPLANVWPRGFGRLMVLEHTGRRTGSRYRTPVNYAVVADDLYCIAGFGEGSDWYRNIRAEPRTAVWLPGGRWEAVVRDVSDDPRRLDLIRTVLIDSGFAAPLFGLHPHRMGDGELARATATYPLLRVRPVRPKESPNGPGDLTWVWWPAAAGVFVTLLRRSMD